MNDIAFELNIRLKNNQDNQLKIKEKIESLPKGHINILYRNNKGYYYLTYRTGNKVNNDYLGPAGKADLKDTMSKLKTRDGLIKELNELKKEEKTLNKLIKKAK